MDNESASGPVFHRLVFAEAIKRELLTDYQVVVGADGDHLARPGACNVESTPRKLDVDSPTPTRGAVRLSAELRMLDASCNECLSAWKPMCHCRCTALIEGVAAARARWIVIAVPLADENVTALVIPGLWEHLWSNKISEFEHDPRLCRSMTGFSEEEYEATRER
jgi:hypothetical protein